VSNWNRHDTGRSRRLWLLKERAHQEAPPPEPRRVHYPCAHGDCAQVAVTYDKYKGLVCAYHALSEGERHLLVSGLQKGYERDMGRGRER
jgi:hypothetical protein